MLSGRQLAQLEEDTPRIRNVSVIAHVSHGKTSLTDHLISSNGVISRKQAGQLRYMDSRPDEQERNITMKASSIALVYAPTPKNGPREHFVVNIIDSPGHVDFSNEVSGAVRVSDGAIVVVDALEGMGVQTQTVLRQAWSEGLKMILVINKVDRLITDMRLSSSEAYYHLRNLLEVVNAFTSTFHVSEAFDHDDGGVYVDIDDATGLHFSPELDNVVFASAADGWAFSISSLAGFLSEKLGMKKKVLKKFLWGDYYYNSKLKTVSTKPKKNGRTMFTEFGLQNIWHVYDEVLVQQHTQNMKKIISSLGITISARELTSNDWKVRLQAIMSTWMPLSNAVLAMVIKQLPSPIQAQRLRLPRIWPNLASGSGLSERVVSSIHTCDSNEEAPCVVMVAKVIAVDSKAFPETRQSSNKIVRTPYVKGKVAQAQTFEDLDATPAAEALPSQSSSIHQDEMVFIAFARVLSGRLRSDTKIWVIGPDSQVSVLDPNSISLYLMQGRDIEPIGERGAAAGTIVGIRGLDSVVLSTATLCCFEVTPGPMANQLTLLPLVRHSHPIIKVVIRSKRIEQMKDLRAGLTMLSKADPNLQIYIEEGSGDQVLVTCGELHVERCIVDLQERFAKGIELVVSEPCASFRETIVGQSEPIWYEAAGGKIRIQMRAFTVSSSVIPEGAFVDDLGNVLIKNAKLDGLVSNAVENGFQLVMRAGPLCEEPMQGVGICLEDIEILDEDFQGPKIGQIMSASKNGCLKALESLSGGMRLVEAIFKVELQVATGNLGRLCTLIEQRRGNITTNELIPGTDVFDLEAFIPAVESFGFAKEVRVRTRGAAYPQLMLSHWEMLDIDPHWIPRTDEELEEFGSSADSTPNLALDLVVSTRKRKGLYVNEQVVEFAEKQATRKNK